MNTLFKLTLISATLALGACTVLDGEKIDYKSTAKAPSLAVPPDLTQLSRDSRYTVVDGAVSAAGSQKSTAGEGANAKSTVAALGLGDVRIERVGNQRWLVINRPAEALWEPIKDFWQENGFLLAMDQKNLGIMETDWAENRAKLPQDFIRKSLGKVLDSFYSTGERDKFRTRIERTDKGIEITVTHRGLVEVFNSTSNVSTSWTARPADAELEIEFLRRMMMRLGGETLAVTTNNAQTGVSSGSKSATGMAIDVSITQIGNQPAIEIKDGFDRAWRRVGVAIDRTGFTVEDRDRGQGVFFVRFAPAGSADKEPGFFGKIFSREKAAPALAKYRIAVTSKGDVSTVVVLAADGLPETSANAPKIIKLLAEEIK